ncbi:MAG TPA: hypothetical protein VIV12_21535, partial [Streptosporangiaceae bacterium]
LAGLPLDEAVDLLDGLHSDRLLLEPIYRRYRMHDLIREYARSLAPRSDSADDPESAIERLLNYYQHIAQIADSHLARRSFPAATVAAVSTPQQRQTCPIGIERRDG